MKNSKTFTIKIDGIEEACTGVARLKDEIMSLEKNVSQFSLNKELGNMFSDVNNIKSIKEQVEIPDTGLIIKYFKELSSTMNEVDKGLDKVLDNILNKTLTITKEKKEKEKENEQVKKLEESVTESIKTSKELVASNKSLDKRLHNVLDDKLSISKPSEEYKEFGLDKVKDVKTPEIAKKDSGGINLEKTKENVKAAKKELEEYRKKLDEVKALGGEFFKHEMSKYRATSSEYGVLEKAKGQFDIKIGEKSDAADSKEKEINKVESQYKGEWAANTYSAMKDFNDKYLTQLQSGLTALQEYYKARKEAFEAEIKANDEVIKKTDKSIADSNKKKQALLLEQETASGNRAQAIKEELEEEAVNHKNLAQKKEELAQKKTKLEEKKKKEERKEQRVGIINGAIKIKATADVSMGIAKALSLGWAGIPIAALIGASGAIQIATIRQQLQKLKFADGGLLRGKQHTQGGMRIEGTNIEVEGDEYVVNRISTRKNLGLIDYINRNRKELTIDDLESYFSHSGKYRIKPQSMSQMYAEGGQLTNLDMVETSANRDRLIMEAIKNINFQPVVSVVDIVNKQNAVAQVREIAGA